MLSVFATRSTTESFFVTVLFWRLTLVKVELESLLEKVESFPHESLKNLWASNASQNWT